MDKNLTLASNKIFDDFEQKIVTLNNIYSIAEEINVFSKNIYWINIINHLLESLSRDKYYTPDNSLHNKINLFTSSNYEFSLIHNPPKNEATTNVPLYTYTNDVFFCPLIDIPNSRYTIYEQNKILTPEVLDAEATLKIKAENHFAKNETICLRKFTEVLKLDETKPLLLLMIASKKDSLKYSWEYNSSTLKPIRIVLRNISLARLGATAKIMGNIGDVNSIPLLAKLSKHESHIVRWEAVRALINIDFDKGLLTLNKMTNDSHVELRIASKKSIEMLNV